MKTRTGKVAALKNARAVRYEIATIRTCIVIIVAFVICYLPFLVYAVILNKYGLSIDLVEMLFYYQFSFISQAGNPIIMFATCTEFRKHVLEFVRRFLRQKEVPAAIELTNLGNGANR